MCVRPHRTDDVVVAASVDHDVEPFALGAALFTVRVSADVRNHPFGIFVHGKIFSPSLPKMNRLFPDGYGEFLVWLG